MKKRIIVTASIVIFLAALVLTLKLINFGLLTIGLIERSAGVDISYTSMNGSILKGFRFTDYRVKLTDTDSIVGDVAEINYRLSLTHFGLPSLIETNLLEPRVVLRARDKSATGAPKKPFKLPILTIGLRVIVKNGEFRYEDRITYSVRKISGLVFLDIVGSKLNISTMNLSCVSDNWPVRITTINSSVAITGQSVAVKSCHARGLGFSLDGTGEYRFRERSLVVDLKQADLDLAVMGVGPGRLTAQGRLSAASGQYRPKLHGIISDLTPLERVSYETNVLDDTILVNLFDGSIWGGDFFAECKIDPNRGVSFVANCRDINIGPFIKASAPVRGSGYLTYNRGSFSGLFSLAMENGPALDSVSIHGRADLGHLAVDSLTIRGGGGTLTAAGSVLPACSLRVVCDRFKPDSLTGRLPIGGELDGECTVRGDLRSVAGLVVDADLVVGDLNAYGIHCGALSLQARQYRFPGSVQSAAIRASAVAYKNYTVDTVFFEAGAGRFTLRGRRGADSVRVDGALADSGRGTVDRVNLFLNTITARGVQPIDFDLLRKKLGAFSLETMGGTLKGSLQPLRLEVQNLDLAYLKRLVKYRDTLQGKLGAVYDGKALSLQARNIEFRGLSDGTIELAAQSRDKGFDLSRLVVKDRLGQSLTADGFISAARSEIRLTADPFGTWPLFFLDRILENHRGLLSGTVKISGTLNDFKMEGEARVEQFSFGLKVIAARFDSISSGIVFEGDRITFKGSRGRIFSTGYNKIAQSAEVTGGGTVRLESKFKTKFLDFEFAFRDAPIQYPPIVYGRGTGNFNLTMKNGIVYYGGVITVKEGVVPIDFGTQFPVPEPGVKVNDNWRMNLKITADRDVWLRNRLADIEFGGDLYIIREQGPLYLAGTLEARRGNFYWFSHTLKTTTGALTFMPADIIDPQIDVTAELNTRERSLKTNEEIKVILHCYGTILEPIFEFYSEPPEYSEQDILTYLNLNVTWRELESIQRGDYVGKALPKSLLALLENDISIRLKKYTGIDVLLIDAPLFDPDQSTKLTVGKYVSRNLFVSYTYDFTYYANQFNVEYFIDDKNEIMVKRDETGAYGVEYRYRIRF